MSAANDSPTTVAITIAMAPTAATTSVDMQTRIGLGLRGDSDR